jgi:hypothetical protein
MIIKLSAAAAGGCSDCSPDLKDQQVCTALVSFLCDPPLPPHTGTHNMQQRLPFFSVLLLLSALGAQGFCVPQQLPLSNPGRCSSSPSSSSSSYRRRSKGAALALFDFLGGGKKKDAKSLSPAPAEKEGLTPAAARRAVKIPDTGACAHADTRKKGGTPCGHHPPLTDLADWHSVDLIT